MDGLCRQGKVRRTRAVRSVSPASWNDESPMTEMMFSSLEEFLKNHEHTVAAIEAISTFAAVVVSLWLALASQRANKPRLKASVSTNIIMHSTLNDKNKPTYVVANITNTGIMPLSVPFAFFHWCASFKWGTWFITPHDYSASDEWVPQKKYPVEIKPRSSENFFLSEKSMFCDQFREVFATANFFDRCRFYYFKAIVITDDGKIFKVAINRRLRKELRELLRESIKAP
jgi:hypothetical protein